MDIAHMQTATPAGTFAPDRLSVDTPADLVVYRYGKRLMDIVLSVLLLVGLLPLFALLVVLIWLDSPGPVLFRQQRVGECGRLFTFLKFRSMRIDADPTVHQEYVATFIRGEATPDVSVGTPLYKLVDDRRVTRVGKWLRRTSLDELPQLWNVLRGQMSLVGPRPPIPYEIEHYQPVHLQRLTVKPGITGLWQVSGRNKTTFEEMVALDIEYIQRRSLLLDFWLLLMTVPAVLLGRDAR
jgi:lipopolysaccharide/colanic/teichoic acid biosynthesis glycosyltransferase